MSRGKLLNRHHKNRLKKKRKNDIFYHESQPINKHVITPKLCSCWLCSKSRKFHGKTIQELKGEQDEG